MNVFLFCYFYFVFFTYSLPSLVFILIVLRLVLFQITFHVVVVLCLFCIVGHSLPQVSCCLSLFVLVVTIFYPICIITSCYSPWFLLLTTCLVLLLFFFFFHCCYSLFAFITIVRFGLLFLTLGCYCLPCIINVHSSFCVTTTRLGTHLTLPCVVIACTSPCVAITCSLPCVYPITYWGVVLPPPLPCASWNLEHEVMTKQRNRFLFNSFLFNSFVLTFWDASSFV